MRRKDQHSTTSIQMAPVSTRGKGSSAAPSGLDDTQVKTRASRISSATSKSAIESKTKNLKKEEVEDDRQENEDIVDRKESKRVSVVGELPGERSPEKERMATKSKKTPKSHPQKKENRPSLDEDHAASLMKSSIPEGEHDDHTEKPSKIVPAVSEKSARKSGSKLSNKAALSDEAKLTQQLDLDKRSKEELGNEINERSSGSNKIKLLNYTAKKPSSSSSAAVGATSIEKKSLNDDTLENDEDEGEEEDMREAMERFTGEQDDNILSLDKALENPTKEKKPTGVVYVGSLPPGLKPKFIKMLLSPHAKIKRMYFEKEDDTKRKRRVALGGSSGYRFNEGWIEFASKKDAKKVALMVNGTRIGRRKGSRFYDDLWMIRYLSGFTWDMLLEKAAIQRREREQRLRLELAKAKKEDEAFLSSVARSKKLKKSEEEPKEEDSAKQPLKKRPLPRQLAPIIEKRSRSKSVSSAASS